MVVLHLQTTLNTCQCLILDTPAHVSDLHLSLEALRNNAFAINMLCWYQDNRQAKISLLYVAYFFFGHSVE